MSNPNETDDIDEGLLEALEAEYMEKASQGDRAAFDFALEYSDEFNIVLQSVGMRLMEAIPVAGPMSLDTALKAAAVAVVSRELLIEAFQSVAPTWASTELERRRKENIEMQDSWKESIEKA